MKISQGFEQATKGDGYTVYKLAISKDEEIVRYGDESMVGKTFEIHTDVGKCSKGKYLSLFLPMDYDIKNFLVEKNFDKIGKMTNNINSPYTEDSFNYTFNDKRKCYLFFKNVDEDFYMYIKASD